MGVDGDFPVGVQHSPILNLVDVGLSTMALSDAKNGA